MPLPLLAYQLTTQNSRVSDLAGDYASIRQSIKGSAISSKINDRDDVDIQIEQAYRQIFFHAMSSDRDRFLESQLRNGTITIRDFIRGLLLSDRFQEGYYQCSSNYRLVDQVVGRVLGRPVYGDAERLALSIVIGEKGFENFVDLLLNSNEYIENFGYDLVPIQRSRILPGRPIGDIPTYQKLPRYGSDWRNISFARGAMSPSNKEEELLQTSSQWVNGKPPEALVKLWLSLFFVGGFEIIRVILTIALSMLRS